MTRVRTVSESDRMSVAREKRKGLGRDKVGGKG